MRQDDRLALLGGRPVRQRPWPKWPRADEETERILRDVLHSGRWTLSGAYAGETCYERRFAKAFADYHGVPYCTPTTSGTAALSLALLALNVGPGDEVLVPGLTWVACAAAVHAVGGVPVLVDVDADTLAMSPEAARSALTERTRALMLVHPFCTLGALDAFVALSDETGIPLIEDCSQAHGATWNGKHVGAFGVVGCFSMQQSKVMTCGEGGALITSDERLSKRVEQLRADGRMFSYVTPRVGRLELVEVGQVQGRNLCLSEFQAALLLDRLQHMDADNAHRAARARRLESLLEGVEGVRPLARPPQVTSRTYYNFLFRLDLDRFAGNTVDIIARAVGEELKTLVHPVYQPMNRHPLYQPLMAPRGDLSDTEWERRNPARFHLPIADQARKSCMTVTHPVLLDDDAGMEEIADALIKVRTRARDLRDLVQDVSREAF